MNGPQSTSSFSFSRPIGRRAIFCPLFQLALAIVVVAETAAAALPAEPAPEPARAATNDPVHALCVDAKGNPVVGAEVYLFQYNGKEARYVQSGPFKSDEQGRVTCAPAIWHDDQGLFDRWVYARLPGLLVGVARSAQFKNRKVINESLQVKLQASRSVDGRVTVPPGFDPTKVTVHVQTLHLRTGEKMLDFQGFPRDESFAGLDVALPEIFDQHPDAAGRIHFDDVPVRGDLYLITRGAGLGEAQWRNEIHSFDAPIEISIDKERALAGRVLSPEKQPVAGAQVSARLSSGVIPGRPFYLSTFRAVTDEKGDFRIRGLPLNKIVLSIEDPKKRWAFRPREDVFGETTDDVEHQTLILETGVPVTGRVIDPEGKPIAGAAISAVADKGTRPDMSDQMTDDEGRYRLLLPAGGAELYFNALPSGFAYPNPQTVKHLEIKPAQAAIEGLDFTLKRTVKTEH